MKKLWFLFSILSSFAAISQSSVKIFAYSQTETPGNIPKGITDENGNQVIKRRETPVKYYIFATHPPSVNIIFTEIWIKGKLYTVETQKIDSTPVIHVNKNMPGNLKEEVLVPYTVQQVIAIVPGSVKNKTLKRCSRISKLANNNELVLRYIDRGKKRFTGIKKIKLLEPIANL